MFNKILKSLGMNFLLKLFVPVVAGILIYACGTPEGMDPRGWKLFAIFASTIIAIILKPLPMGAVALLSMIIAVITKTLDLGTEALSGYGSPVIWLVVYVFFIARGFIKTRLGTRLAYFFVSLLGKRTLGLGYGIVATELLIAPVIPSNAARAGGIMYPILKSIAESLGSKVGDGTERRLGAFLTQVCNHGNLITSAMFLTAMAANPMAQSIAREQGVLFSWGDWFLAACVPGLLSAIIIPFVLYIIYPPQEKVLPHAVQLAKNHLKEMGPMSRSEWLMTFIFLFMLIFWVQGHHWGIDSTVTALMGLGLLVLTGVLTWDDILNEKEAWHTLVWFAILVTMAKYLQVFGFITWFSKTVAMAVSGVDPTVVLIALVLIYFYSHYFFASNTAHVGAMYGAFLAVAIASGAPPVLSALLLGFSSSLFSAMTHYGSASNVMFYGTGYVPIGTWWGLGFIVSVLNLLIWIGVGGLWWKVLGLW